VIRQYATQRQRPLGLNFKRAQEQHQDHRKHRHPDPMRHKQRRQTVSVDHRQPQNNQQRKGDAEKRAP
jgi:hypothetical protein